MAKQDLRLDLGFYTNGKTKQLIRRLGDSAIVALQKLWIDAAINHQNGFLPMDAEGIAATADWKGDAEEFVSALLRGLKPDGQGFLEVAEGGYKLHDWEQHQPYIFHAKERSETARIGGRVRAAQMALAKSKQTASESLAPSPSPSPYPSPYPSPKEEEILDVLRGVAGYPFDEKTDLAHYRKLVADFPSVDVLEIYKQWSAYVLDHPLGKKSSPRAQLRTFCRKQSEWNKQRGAAGNEQHRRVGRQGSLAGDGFDLGRLL